LQKNTATKMDKNFNAKEAEAKWLKYWEENKTFHSEVNEKPSYTIVIPPPNVTGVLHMGHVLNNSLQDFFIRKARKEGFNALWVPGTDHASIATEAKVVQMLREKGIKKSDLSREDFLKHAFEWKEKYGGIIINQLKAIGCSCDWSREEFTMNEDYYKAVIRVFVDLHKKGYIYKGKRIINWDCEAKTALSNEEVIYKDTPEKSKLFHIKYAIEGSSEFLTIATTRPETIFGDVAIAINPKDERYAHLKGQKAIVPLINKAIPIIFDDYVDKDFGTGCLKVTPAHDINDYEIGVRHELPFLDILNDDGTLNAECSYPDFVGLDRFKVRKMIEPLLEEKGHLAKVEEIENKIGRSERTNTVVEPKLSLQWFIDMKRLSKKAHEVVMNDEVILFPAFHKNTYNHWMSNVRDWCISRQLWWGHRIPAYYMPNDEFVVAENIEEAFELAKKIDPNIKKEDLRQDEDVLDTWASSWLWPMEVFKGYADDCFNKETGKIDLSKNKELNYYYPTKMIVTGSDILFFWIARMIIAGYEYTDTKPFEKVYLTGMVRDKLGRKMSKQLGNSPDLFELIERFGLDSVRFGMMSISPAGNDILFDEKSLEIGRNFGNKLWNAFRLVKGWEIYEGKNEENQAVMDWFAAKLQLQVNSYLQNIENLRISEAFKDLYTFIWDDFCSWYLELIKPDFEKPIDRYTYDETIQFFETILSILNPIMPIITEELWANARERKEGEICALAPHPTKKEDVNAEMALIKNSEAFFELIIKSREVRANLKMKNRETIGLSIDSTLLEKLQAFIPKIKKLVWAEVIDSEIGTKTQNALLIENQKVFVNSEKAIDSTESKQKIEEEIQYTRGFVASVEAKLKNEKFVNNAPAKVLEMEQKKLQDGLERLKSLETQLANI
jgi:valyl-tRNA synthetase